MAAQKGRDFLLKIGDGAIPEVFTTLGAARVTALRLDNQPQDITDTAGSGAAQFMADGGIQTMELTLDGLFKDSVAEELLRQAAFNRSLKNYKLYFPNGDVYAAAFAVQSYRRGGSYDGLEVFSAALLRSGAGVFTPHTP